MTRTNSRETVAATLVSREKRRMSRRKGELSNAGIDRQWPHQIALKAPLGQRLPDILKFSVGARRGPQNPSFRRGDEDSVCIAFKEVGRPGVPRSVRWMPMKPADRPKWHG